MTGTIPSELGHLTNMNNFGAGRNQFNGTIPKEFGNLIQLQHFIVWKNELTGSFLLNLDS